MASFFYLLFYRELVLQGCQLPAGAKKVVVKCNRIYILLTMRNASTPYL